MNTADSINFITGPQVPIGDSWFDRTQIEKGKVHGEACPSTPPTDDNGLNSYILQNYYDLPLTMCIAHRRANDPQFLTLFRKCADAWWLHPTWIGGGTIRQWPDSASPPPRHAGLGGLMLRALDGRSEMWDWIVNYTLAHLDMWCKSRINNTQLWYGPREVAFTLQYAAWVAAALPDSYPNASQIRLQLIADLENLAVNYTGRLQYPDGSWRDSSEWVDADGGTMVNSMQPFIVGLLTSALADVHQVVVNETAKESVKNQILKACRHLYSDGPYAKDLIEQKTGRKVRGFHYFYHGGTTVNPTKYEHGDLIAPWTDLEGWWLSGARQAISTILPAFGYAYKISGDEFFKTAGDEMYDAAYNGTDGARAMMDDTAKNYNQHARRVGSYLAWTGATQSPLPVPEPIPTPIPPPTTPEPTPMTPSPDNTKARTITDSTGAVWTIGGTDEVGPTLRDGIRVGGGTGSVYKFSSGVVYVLGTDGNWYKWTGMSWVSVGQMEPGTVVAPTPTPEPSPAPAPPRYSYVERPWMTGTTSAARASNLKTLNEAGALGLRFALSIGTTAYFEKLG